MAIDLRYTDEMQKAVILFLFLILTACAGPISPTSQPRELETAPVANLSPTPETSAPTPPPPENFFQADLLPQYQNDLNSVQDPTIYKIDIRLDPSLTRLDGKQSVVYTNREQVPLNEIYFRLFANYPGSGGSATVGDVNVNGAKVTPELQANDTALRVPLGQPLAPGERANIDLDFSVSIPISNTGHYNDFINAGWITALPTVYPLIPAYDEKGWHIEVPPPYGDLVYADSSLYDVTVTAPSASTVIASGVTVDKSPVGDQTVWHISAAPVRDFDLNLSSELQKSSLQVNGTTINSWYLPKESQAGKDVLKFATDSFKVYNQRIGAYPFKELDVVETPTTAGGIEYPGLVTIAREPYTNADQLAFLEITVAHEVAHQWFYSLVGNDQVNDPWLDESLVQYMMSVYLEDTYGKEEADITRKQYFNALYDTAKRRNKDAPVGLPVSAYDEEQYAAIVYGKGPLFFAEVRNQLGDQKFFAALQAYFQKRKYQIATPADLIDTFNEVSGQDITPLYDKWIEGK